MSLIKRLVTCTLFLMILFPPHLAIGNETIKCPVCGMDLNNYCHTEYIINTKDGKLFRTCGVQCGLTLQLRLRNRFKDAIATDLLSHKKIRADEAFYVFKSSVITDMAPGFIAFKRKKDADRFSEAFGGAVLTYQEAIKLWERTINK